MTEQHGSGQSGQSAVLLLAHGTPNTLGEMAEYLSRVTGGRALPPEVVRELQHRYAQIGLGEAPGTEPPPLTKWTLAQGRLLEKAMRAAGHPARVYVAMRNWRPYIPDMVAQMRRDGVTRIKAICLAPQNSRTSVGLYRRDTLAVATGMEVEFIAGWADHPLLVAAFAERLRPAWTRACAEAGERVPVLFTAHSVPCRTVMSGPDSIPPDPYPVEAKRTAALVAESLADAGFGEEDWYFAFQSQGVSGGPWIGPTVEESLKAIRAEGHTGVVIQPIGFLCDHVEILYDIDIAFKAIGESLGLKLWRSESLNDSEWLIRALNEIASRVPSTVVEETTVSSAV